MRKVSILGLFLLIFSGTFAQFSTSDLRLRFGYNLHNVHAKRFNHLVSVFNDERYPFEIKENLAGLHWMHGLVLGADYAFREDMYLHFVLKSRRQYMEAEYVQVPMHLSYLFRQHSLETGITMRLKEENRFSHYLGAGVTFGVLGVFTDWSEESGYKGSREMFPIHHTASVGLSLSYEARFKLHDNFELFLRPVAQYSLDSYVRRLSDFFAPHVNEDGTLSYLEGEGEKYDKGSVNGLGIEGGLLISLPDL